MNLKEKFNSAILSCVDKCKKVWLKIKDTLKSEISVTRMCLILSAYTLIVFHGPFYDYLLDCEITLSNGLLILATLTILMLVINFLVYYILLYLGRVVGKVIICLTLIGNAVALYFIDTYNVLIDMQMMGNVFHTQSNEASGFLSWTIILYVLIYGIPPCIWIFYKKIRYGKIWKFLLSFFTSIIIIIGALACNVKNILWIDYHAPILGSKIMPWSYIVNSIRYYNYWKFINQPEIMLPDATIATDSRDIFVLIIGESVRSQNLSLYGYERETTPLMASDSVVALKARASETYTRAAVKAILSPNSSEKLYELLPNYLYRNGVDVIWRTNNWGTNPIKVKKLYSKQDLSEMYPDAKDSKYDGILYHGLKEQIEESDSTKIFIGIHTYTSHGPEYFNGSPEEFKVYTPECTTVEMSKANYNHLVNAYDNTICYTDYLVHSVIQTLKNDFPDRRSCVIFISDHGESLGEGGFYMHGTPLRFAPKEQLDIPFIVWTSDKSLKIKDLGTAGHYNIYHTALRFLGMETPVYDESKDIFE